MAIIRRLDASFTGVGLNAPKLIKYDKIESPGSILLLDATHPVKQTKSTAVVNNDVVPNIFSESLKSLSGATTGLDSVVSDLKVDSNNPRVKIERTAKGGIHAMVQQTANINVADKFSVNYPQAVLDYMNANKGHAYYVSLWQRTTRATNYPAGGLSPVYQQLAYTGSTTTLVIGTNSFTSHVSNTGYNITATNTEQNHLFAFGASKVHDSGLAVAQSYAFLAGGVGAWNGSGTAGSGDELPSQIFYRTYIEDLTVSGRTYAQVYALDNELYTKEVLTAGGRYYGDTFTAPSSVSFPA